MHTLAAPNVTTKPNGCTNIKLPPTVHMQNHSFPFSSDEPCSSKPKTWPLNASLHLVANEKQEAQYLSDAGALNQALKGLEKTSLLPCNEWAHPVLAMGTMVALGKGI